MGQGNWARVPWIAVLDPRETDSTQHGTYPVILIPESLDGVYLTLAQGVTELKQQLGRPGPTTKCAAGLMSCGLI